MRYDAPESGGAEGFEGDLPVIRILLVDDHALYRVGMRNILQTEDDFEVVATASSGEEAIERIRETMPDIVLMDIDMPGIGGMEACKVLRQLSRHQSTRIVACTAHSALYAREVFLNTGFDDILPKPFSYDDLLGAVSPHLG